jgi:O-antigen ligase
MTDNLSKSVAIVGVALSVLLLAFLAYSRPGYFTSETYLGGLLLLEFLFAAIWAFRRVFFPLVILTFLLAGVNLPVGGVWTIARWLFLCAGFLVGTFIMLKERHHHFGLFHALALFAVLSAIVSAAVSRYPDFALLKAVSLLLLFGYAATGARLAMTGREIRFFRGLLLGSEVFVGIVGAFYLVGIEVMGNPNSLGAVMGVVGCPILLWGTMLEEEPIVHQRRLGLFAVSVYLVFHSLARAAMVAAFISCGLLCIALRRYRLLGQGVIIILIALTASAIFNPEGFSRTMSTLTTSVVFKGKDPTLGVFGSRQSPWQAAVDTIKAHFWFGTGFGTTDNGTDASAHLGKFSSGEGITAENGSSYLTIATWVGMLGVFPFALLLLMLAFYILRTVRWMLNSENPAHPAIPLAMLMIAGLLHAGFEDWLFAPGYYLCVFFWSLAFVFVDLLPTSSVRRLSPVPQPSLVRRTVGNVATTR